jgi:D-beta-D-heptose 7-phosphate kinase/D-beta-D-heptose 1-phosphate adenosyltransferase
MGDDAARRIGVVAPLLLDRFSAQTVVVIGDVMLDRYWWGGAARLSPEAPVPVIRMERITESGGGAANVAANVAGLGGVPMLVGLIGDDDAGRALRRVLATTGVASDHLVVSRRRPTTVKTRIIATHQHVVRVDEEDATPATDDEARELLDRARPLFESAHVVVLSDYAKGALGPTVVRALIEAARDRGLPVLVDPKGEDYSRYDGATLLAPNRLEAATAAKVPGDRSDTVHCAGRRLLEGLDVAAIVVTQGEEGMTVFQRGQAAVRLPTRTRVVYDVTGAGDSVMAVLALTLGAGADIVTAAALANVAGGIAVERLGTTVVTAEALRQTIRNARRVRRSPTPSRPAR